MKFAPIILFAYNRPHYLKETLNALKNNAESAESDLYIYCDGPRLNIDENTRVLIREVRELARSEQWCKNVYVIESESNKGLSRSIIHGITEVINKYDRIIVLEDDIVVAPFFLNYMNTALEKYKDTDDVAEISGYNYPIGNLIKNKETFFLKSISCWGWATWKRAWELYNDDANELLLALKNKELEAEFNFQNTFRYVRMLEMTMQGRVDSWFIKWYASCFLENKLTLYPAKSLVKNIGMIGTHVVGDNTEFMGSNYDEGEIVDFDNSIAQDMEIRKLWENHYKLHNRRKLNYRNIIYAISKIKMKLKL